MKGSCHLYAATELKNYKEQSVLARPHGGSNSLEGGATGNWFERRRKESDFEDSSPTVLLIGAGT